MCKECLGMLLKVQEERMEEVYKERKGNQNKGGEREKEESGSGFMTNKRISALLLNMIEENKSTTQQTSTSSPSFFPSKTPNNPSNFDKSSSPSPPTIEPQPIPF